MRRAGAAAGVLAAVVVVSGCANIATEVSTLKPVAGDALTSVNIAVNDVLQQQEVDVLVAPVCAFADDTYSCAGSTVSGDTIEATAVGAEAETVTIVVGGKQIFSGSIDDVIQKAGQR